MSDQIKKGNVSAGGAADDLPDVSWIHEPDAGKVPAEREAAGPPRPDAAELEALEPPVLEPAASEIEPTTPLPTPSPEAVAEAPWLPPVPPAPPPIQPALPAPLQPTLRAPIEPAQEPAPVPRGKAETTVDEAVAEAREVESVTDILARAQETSRRHQEEEEENQRDFEGVVEDVERHRRRGYDLIGMAGYSGSGKTHFLRALSLLLKKQGFEVAEWEAMRRSRIPLLTEATVFDHPVTGPGGERWVFVDAGGELYARLRLNNWDVAADSAALLHSLHFCRGLFLLLNLQPGHFRLEDAGTHRWMSSEEKERDAKIQRAQEELEFFDQFLLFLRALSAEGGQVQKLVVRCAEDGLDKALRPYRDKAPKLAIPVQVLFTQADTYGDGGFEVAEAIPLSPRKTTVGVAAFVARYLPDLMGTLLQHARRFRFDFVHSYEEKTVLSPDDVPRTIPEWHAGGELLSCGALSALEFLARNMPAKSRLGRARQRLALETRGALKLDRWLHRQRWQGVEVPL